MSGNSVDQILQDNGYAVVDSPQPDDLVIYRNSNGGIVHTGLVRGVLNDGTVMVESKWGVDGRFLHQPKDTPYGEHYAFYRSHRTGHLVSIRPSTESHFANGTGTGSRHHHGCRHRWSVSCGESRTEDISRS